MTATTPVPAQAMSSRTVQTYGQDWALFTDWCAATNNPHLPADPATVLEFLTCCPASRSTNRCRVAAIDHHHAATGHPKPGESTGVRAALGRPIGESSINSADLETVRPALLALPSHGWTQGMFGRRDRCLLALSQLAGVPYQQLANLTVRAITVADGGASVASAANTWTLTGHDNPLLCGPCAITRWLRALDVEMTTPSTRVLAKRIGKAKPVTARSPHLCRSTRRLSPATLDAPLITPIDQWGYVPFPPRRLTPHSLSRRVRDILSGDFGAHRHLPIDLDDDTAPETPSPDPMVKRAVYSKADSQRAWARRRADLDDLAGLDTVLDAIDARAKELVQRTAAILVEQTDRTAPAYEE